jgi:hypothetical protein
LRLEAERGIKPRRNYLRCNLAAEHGGIISNGVKGREGMEYDLKAMDLEIKAIEERTKKLKELGNGFEAVERNADSILTFVFLLKKNVSDLIE